MNTLTINKKYPTVTKQELVECLKQARKLISRKSWWTWNVHARDKRGLPVHPSSDEAKCFCAYGAIIRASNDNVSLEVSCVASLLRCLPAPVYSIVDYNDTAENHKKVVELFDTAINRVEKELP